MSTGYNAEMNVQQLIANRARHLREIRKEGSTGDDVQSVNITRVAHKPSVCWYARRS